MSTAGVEIQFYHLQSSPLEVALPKLLQKACERQMRSLIKTRDMAQAKQLSDKVWTHDPNSFLPHGLAGEKQAEVQPILIGNALDNANASTLLFVTDGTSLEAIPEGVTRVIDMFHGADSEAVQAARARWKQYKDAGHTITYYQQTAQGGWQKKA